MAKNQNKQILKYVTQVTKQKAPLYPYYPVSTKFQDKEQMFIFSVEYPVGVACITFFMIDKSNSRKNGVTNIQLAGINDRSAISIIQIIDFKYKEMPSTVWPLQGTILVGYREGQLVMVNFKQKKTQVIHKFNKLVKKQGLMDKASSFFSTQQAYRTSIRGPIKQALYSPSKKYVISYLVGNVLVMHKTKDDKSQQNLQKQYKLSIENTNKKAVKIVMQEGLVLTIKGMQICSYSYTQSEQIFVAFSMQSTISCFSSKDLSLLYSLKMTMPIRKINFHSFPQGDFLTILPYEDYAILINLNHKQFVKLIGYRCFIANSVIYRNQVNSLVFLSGGLDHRVCFDKIEDIKGWHVLTNTDSVDENHIQFQSQNNGYFIDQDKNGVQFSNKYSLGEYSNARTNSHDYGFSDLIFGQNLATFPTYDGKIKVFMINYK